MKVVTVKVAVLAIALLLLSLPGALSAAAQGPEGPQDGATALASDVLNAPLPAWPRDIMQPHAVFSASGLDGGPGFWLWNPSRFAGPPEGPFFWSPGWEWYSVRAATTDAETGLAASESSAAFP